MTPVKALAVSLIFLTAPSFAQAEAPTHNVILFVTDGLRAVSVDPVSAPALAEVRDKGVNFQDSHSLFPTVTTANASAFATGHYLGDTGDWGNSLYVGFPVKMALDSVTPFLESDTVLGELDAHFGGNYLGEQTVMAAARAAGYGTAAVGKLGPTLIQDHTARDGQTTIIIDDATGKNTSNDGPRRGIPLSPAIIAAMDAAGLPLTAPGSDVPNREQQDYFTAAFIKVVLPTLKAKNKPFYAVFWSRDPDGSQHNQNDSKNRLVPGINGPTSQAAIHNADDDLAKIRAALKAQGLDGDTDIVIAADHGFSTISKESATSFSVGGTYDDTPAGQMPSGFFAIDLAHSLNLPLFDPDNGNRKFAENTHPKHGNAIIGGDTAKPEIVVTANGGADFVYLPQSNASALVPKIVAAVLGQDYVSGIYVRDDLGAIPGTLPMSAINLKGAALTPSPAVIVGFKSFSTGCDNPLKCAIDTIDGSQGQGQGNHGSFSRADTYNFQAAIGPDFKTGFVDTAPSSNADIAVTIAHILKLQPVGKGKLTGRVLVESLPGGQLPVVKSQVLRSAPAANGLVTLVDRQSVGETHYFDAGGFAGRTLGLVP